MEGMRLPMSAVPFQQVTLDEGRMESKHEGELATDIKHRLRRAECYTSLSPPVKMETSGDEKKCFSAPKS